MTTLSVWLGLMLGGSILGWAINQPGGGANILDRHGLFIVIGGAVAAMLTSTPASQLFSAIKSLFWILLPRSTPTPEETLIEIVSLSRKARAGGGLLALKNESPEFMGGFVRRAIEAAAACGETNAARHILEIELRRRRVVRQEDANVFRTLGTLAPMFGLLGTLVGMLKVLTTMSDPTKLGPAMAMALSSAFIGIGMANFFCVPVAGQIRLQAMREMQLLDMVIEGVLAIAMNEPTYQVELKMSSYVASPRSRGPA